MIRDTVLEKSFFKEPIISLVEWIPFGPHQFEHLVSALMSSWSSLTEKPSFLTDKREEEPKECFITLESEMARIAIRDYRPGEMISFTADIYYPEAEGIRQEEQVGVNIFSYGLVICSSQISTVLYDEASAPDLRGELPLISLDRASRIVCDLMEDTSRLLSTLLTPYQRRMLDVIYPLSERELYERKKLCFIFTTDLVIGSGGGQQSSWEIGDLKAFLSEREDIKMELQQVIGDVIDVRSYKGLRLIEGSDGLVFILKDLSVLWGELRNALLLTMLFYSINLFFKHLMARAWMIWDRLMQVRSRCFGPGRGEAIMKDRESLSEMLSNVVLLEDACVAIKLSVRHIEELVRRLGEDKDDVLGLFRAHDKLRELNEKVEQAENTLHALRTDIEGLIGILTTLAEEEMRQIRMRMEQNIRAQVRMMQMEQVENESLRIIEVFSGGLLAVEILALIFIMLEGVWGIRLPPGVGAFIKFAILVGTVVGFYWYLKWRAKKAGEELSDSSGRAAGEMCGRLVVRPGFEPGTCGSRGRHASGLHHRTSGPVGRAGRGGI